MRWPRSIGGRPSAGEGQDSARFRALLLPHLDAAYGYARYLARDDHVAEDIVQEAFVRALRAIGECRGNPKAWLLTIVRNAFYDWTRANSRTAPHDIHDTTACAQPDAILEQTDAIASVRHMIESLPEPFRAVLVLRELEDMSYREIAEITGAPVGTVMSRLARARGMLSTLVLGETAPVTKRRNI
ncbi:MAG: sigma-70 family RNA polymerase sigma factor [Sphingomonadales bacterium]|nr:MAG: sigma-70 family RNA polymerase sigma factor [Sphingomonadales bacterium]